MHIKKDKVADLLRDRGDHDKAANVTCSLPEDVDTEQDAGLLHSFDLSVREVRAKAEEPPEA